MSSTEAGPFLGWHRSDDLDCCEADLREGSLAGLLAPQTRIWQGHLLLRASQAVLTHSLRDLTVSVLLAEKAGDSWGDGSSANTGESLHGSYCSGSFRHRRMMRVLTCILF